MDQQQLFEPIPVDKMSMFTKEELIILLQGEQKIRQQIEKDNDRLRQLNDELEQKSFYIEDQFITLKNKYFGKSSEKQPSREDKRKYRSKNRKKKVQLPSERYPNAALIEREVILDNLPSCKCCGDRMSDSGMTENSEFVTVVPTQFIVIRQKRHKYRCDNCHGDIVTAPSPPRIKSGSNYSDKMMIDVALSKYCDLIPIERYAGMAERQGLLDLPPQSLIALTHYLADFLGGAYELLKKEIKTSRVLNADETPHRMLEDNNDKKKWYLWGFSTPITCYFEVHSTRSGDVASEILRESSCEYLVSDVFSGYGRTVKVSNKFRKEKNLPMIKNVYCNAHSRRKFKEAKEKFPEEADFYIKIYGKIYRLNKMSKRWPEKKQRLRRYMKPLFEKLKARAMANIKGYSSKSKLVIAMNYFLRNYEGLTLFLEKMELPIDNNSQESLLRCPVVGRKTWYGNHSQRGAKTTAVLFSLVESCKLNKVNPREYFKKLVEDLHKGGLPYTPATYAMNAG